MVFLLQQSEWTKTDRKIDGGAENLEKDPFKSSMNKGRKSFLNMTYLQNKKIKDLYNYIKIKNLYTSEVL